MRDYNALAEKLFALSPTKYLNSKAPSYKKVKWLSIIGTLMISTGVFLIVAIPIIVTIAMHLFVKLEEGSIQTWVLKKVPIAVSVNIYLWNLDNPDEFAEGNKNFVN